MKLSGFAAVPFLLVAAALAAGAPNADDEIAVQLLKDKEAYSASIEKAKEDLLKAFDKHYDSVKNNKTLKIEAQVAQLDKIEEEKKSFQENGVLPLSVGMKAGVSEFRAAQKKAEAACKAAFEKAAKAYRDKGDVKMAGAVLDEMKEFLASAPGAGGNPYYITSKLSGKVFGVKAPIAEGGRVTTADFSRTDTSQQWRTIPFKDGWVYIENAKSGLVLTVPGKDGGTDATLAKRKANDDQQLWKLVPVAGQAGAVKFLNKGSEKVLGVDGRNKGVGVRIILWGDENDSSQWYATPPVK